MTVDMTRRLLSKKTLKEKDVADRLILEQAIVLFGKSKPGVAA